VAVTADIRRGAKRAIVDAVISTKGRCDDVLARCRSLRVLPEKRSFAESVGMSSCERPFNGRR
jgi:hypothetical protein